MFSSQPGEDWRSRGVKVVRSRSSAQRDSTKHASKPPPSCRLSSPFTISIGEAGGSFSEMAYDRPVKESREGITWRGVSLAAVPRTPPLPPRRASRITTLTTNYRLNLIGWLQICSSLRKMALLASSECPILPTS